jgi:hypothetical protein
MIRFELADEFELVKMNIPSYCSIKLDLELIRYFENLFVV